MWLGAIAAYLGATVGCQRSVNIPQGKLLGTQIPGDEAMQVRDWDRSVAYYQNPRFVAGPTGYWYETPYYPPQWWYAGSDTILFVGQTFGLPVTLIAVPPWTMVEYAGETIEPTYHAMPPLPPASYEAAEAQEFEPMPRAPPEEPVPPTEPIEPMPPVEPATPSEPAPLTEPTAPPPPP